MLQFAYTFQQRLSVQQTVIHIFTKFACVTESWNICYKLTHLRAYCPSKLTTSLLCRTTCRWTTGDAYLAPFARRRSATNNELLHDEWQTNVWCCSMLRGDIIRMSPILDRVELIGDELSVIHIMLGFVDIGLLEICVIIHKQWKLQ